MLFAVPNVAAFAREETTDVSFSRFEETDEPFGEKENEGDFNYFVNLWRAFENATVWTFLFPELLIASVILGIAGPPLSIMLVGYSYVQFIRAIGGVPIAEDFSYTFEDGWNEIKRIFFHKFSTEG